MNNLKLESGFTQIPNELLEIIYSTKFNATQLKIILVVWRYTYGFQRKSYKFAEVFLSKATGIHKIQLSKEIKKLIEMNVLIVTKPPTYSTPREIMFNKNYNEWKQKDLQLVNSLTVSKKANTTVSQSTNTTVSKNTNQEINNINKTINKTICAFFEELWKLYPNKKGKGQISNSKKKKLYDIGIDELTRAINRYINEKEADDWKHYQNGSTFFNSGYVDYLDCNYEDKKYKEDKADKEDLPVITSEVIEQIEQTDNQDFRTVEELKNMTLEEMFK